ncbi:22411_t:CDS:1, partial [Racocetra persica]
MHKDMHKKVYEDVHEDMREDMYKDVYNDPDLRITTMTEDPIQKIFEKIFVNDLWSCNSPVKKPYYSAKIYPIICYQCRNKEIYKPEKIVIDHYVVTVV